MWILNNLWDAQEARRVLTGIVSTNSLLKQKRILIHLMIQIHFACFLYWVEKATPFVGLVLFCFLCNVFLGIFFFFELEKTLGTRMEHSAVMLTHRSISSTLNQVSPHGTVWTNQVIQSQFTTPNLDSHSCVWLHSGLSTGAFSFCYFTEYFFLTENFVTSTLFSPGYSDGRGEATNVCFLYQEQ